MAYFTLLWKARTIERYRLNYEKEKLNSIKLTNAQSPRKTLYQKWCIYNLNTKKRLSKVFLRQCPKGSAINNFFFCLRTDQTSPNFVLQSVIGFVGGIILTYLCFMFFVFQLSISLIHATIMSSIIGVLLTLGLAFSYRIRCLVFLLIPQFFSRVGRYTLTCYALVLILTGPATNTLKNSEVLSESLACGQEQIKTNMRVINESVKKPMSSMKESIRIMIASLQQLAARLKLLTLKIHRLALSVAYSLQASYAWLASTVDSCNKKLGAPYIHCMDAITNSIVDCRAIFGPRFSDVCDVATVTKAACWPLYPLKNFCHGVEFVNGNILAVVRKKLKIFSDRMNAMLYVEVHIHHSYSFSGNASKSASQVAAGIVTEIRHRADPLLTWLSWSSCVTSLSLLLIIFRAKYYQHMFETRSRFDNRYVTKELRDLDLKRLKQRKETVLPLNRREEGKYIKTTSFRLVSSEKVHLSRSAVTMAITTFKLMIHMVADYSLYWVLMTIRYHGRLQTPLQPGSPDAGVHVAGSGLISKIMKSLIRSISLPLAMKPSSPIACLPNPHPPDLQRYSQIGILIFLLWFFALFEPYGLRLRHVIMGLYQPQRAKARAVWLYNHIQRTRGGFMKFARRKLHREYKYSSEEKHTFQQWLNSHIPCLWLKDFLGINADDPHCFLCGIIEDCNECDGTLTRCDTPLCPGTYCIKCFSDIGQLCTICLKPEDYGDFSDVSLEKGSSDESDSDDSNNENSSSDNLFLQNTVINIDDERTHNIYFQNKLKEHWMFLPSKNGDSQNDSLLSKDSEDKESKVQSEIINKSLKVRHKKYANLDLQNKRRIELATLGQDTHCAICSDYFKSCDFHSNKAIYVINSEFTERTEKTVKQNSRMKNIASKINTNGKNKKSSRKNLILSESDTSIAKLLERFRNLRKYSVIPNGPCKNALNRNNVTKHLSLHLSLSSLKKRRLTPRKRKKKTTNVSCNKITSSKPLKYPSKKKHSPFHKLKRKICRLIFNLRRRKLGFKYYYENDTRCSTQTGTSKDEIRRRGSDILKSADNFIMNSSNIDVIHTNKDRPSNEGTQKRKKIEKEENKEITIKYVETKKSFHREKLYDLYTDYWKKATVIAPSVKIVNFFKRDDLSQDYEKTNHKRRKKIEDMEKSRIIKKNNEATRKYRISSFLSEQEWMKRRCSKEKLTNNLETINETTKEATQLENGSVKVLDENDYVSNFEEKIEHDGHDNTQTVMTEKHEVTALKPIRKSSTKKQKIVTSSSITHKNNNVTAPLSINKSLTRENKACYSSQPVNYGMPRALKYYRDLGHNDFQRDDEFNDVDHDHSGLEKKNKSVEADGDHISFRIEQTPVLSRKETQTSHRQLKLVKIYDTKEVEKNSKEVSTDPENSQNNQKQNRLKNPFAVLFPCCSRKKKVRKTDAEVAAFPVLKNCSCQYLVEEPVSERTTQVYQMKEVAQSISHDLAHDVAVDAVKKTCTCATQYMKRSKNAGTSNECQKCKLPALKTWASISKDTSTPFCNKTHTKNNIGAVQRDRRKLISHSGVQCQLEPPIATITHRPRAKDVALTSSERMTQQDEQATELTSNESIMSFDSLHSISSIRSDDGTRTDTTVYSLATVEYAEAKKKRNRLKVSVKTKTNRSTETDRTKLCDVSTVTSDWWTPILERKDKSLSLSQKEGSQTVEQMTARKKFKNTGITTEGRVVTFQSHTQIIPPSRHIRYFDSDIMSPSRYLLESQKYYNELFATRIYAPHVLSVNSIQRGGMLDKCNANRTGRKRKNYKTKRLEECYSPRKATPRERTTDQMRISETSKQQKLLTTCNKKYRSGSKQCASRKTKSCHRYYYGKPILDVKRGQVNLLTRCYLSNDDLSLTSK